MTTEDEEKKNQDEHETSSEVDLKDANEFITALNRFVLAVASMDWPEGFPLDKNDKFCFRVFERYWRTHNRKRQENEQANAEFHMRQKGEHADPSLIHI